MTALLDPPLLRRVLTVLLAGGFAAADDLIRNLRFSGATVHHWSAASAEEGLRLTLDVSADAALLAEVAVRHGAYHPSDSACFELALVTVTASGDAQDEAAAIIADAGGRLLALGDDSLTAHVSNRPEKIESMLQGLRLTAPVEAVRSGPLVLRTG